MMPKVGTCQGHIVGTQKMHVDWLVEDKWQHHWKTSFMDWFRNKEEEVCGILLVHPTLEKKKTKTKTHTILDDFSEHKLLLSV